MSGRVVLVLFAALLTSLGGTAEARRYKTYPTDGRYFSALERVMANRLELARELKEMQALRTLTTSACRALVAKFDLKRLDIGGLDAESVAAMGYRMTGQAFWLSVLYLPEDADAENQGRPLTVEQRIKRLKRDRRLMSRLKNEFQHSSTIDFVLRLAASGGPDKVALAMAQPPMAAARAHMVEAAALGRLTPMRCSEDGMVVKNEMFGAEDTVTSSPIPLPRQTVYVAPKPDDDPEARAFAVRLLQTAPWTFARKAFPDWYREQANELSELARQGKGKTDVARALLSSFVAFRRAHSSAALNAPAKTLEKTADSFRKLLQHLASNDAEECRQYLMKGELSEVAVNVLASEKSGQHLQDFLGNLLISVSEGELRNAPQKPDVKPPAAVLLQALNANNWSREDIELFSSPQAMSQAPADRVCKLMKSYFDAVLDVPQVESKRQLIIQALMPIFAG